MERITQVSNWNKIIANLPAPHLLQTWEWAQLKSRYGWQPWPVIWRDVNREVEAAALVLQRSLPVRGFASRLQLHYVPKGPLLDWRDTVVVRRVLDDLGRLTRHQNGIFIKIDPDVVLGTGIPGSPDEKNYRTGHDLRKELLGRGWRLSPEQVQFQNTVMIDLNPDEETLLAQMKQKTRYNIHLAERKGVRVRMGGPQDLELLYRMYAETSVRDRFVIRPQEYYQDLWRTFLKAGQAQALIAEVEGEPVSALWLFLFERRAWYLFGMSTEAHRDKMPNYLLQWEAIRRAKAAGCAVYDLWGAPDEFDESDPLWGVYRFKDGLGGQVVRHIGAYDLPVRPTLYAIYTRLLPRLLNLMRKRGIAETQNSIQ
jgi:peptidoglycan pentaglycine glycine transferase (the first glycine)